MAKPGDVISHIFGEWVFVVTDVDEDGEPMGGYAVPKLCTDTIDELVAFIKEPIDPQAVIREAERIIEEARK